MPVTRERAIHVFSHGNAHEIINALLAVVLNGQDWKWSQEHCLHFLNHSDFTVRRVAALCLGHIAGIHGQLDKERVIITLQQHLVDKKISGSVQDALEDIEMFL